MSELPAASLRESVQVLAGALLPSVVRGLFSPRPRMLAWLTRIDADGRTIRLLARLRARHGGQGVRLLRGKMVVVWGREALREVLDGSATVYGSDAGAKAKGMAHFQPDALTLSRGEDWRDRRAFAEHVLATSERVHPSADRFLAVVADEVDRLRIGDRLAWADWERLWDRITLRVVFGDRARDEQALTGLLEQLMAEANRLAGAGKHGDAYYELYGKLERHLIDPEPGSLVARIADAPQSDRTRIAQQIPHWIFAMRDTLGANAFRALAAISADPALERRVRDELAGADLSDPGQVAGLNVLEGAFQEAMRLWPTVPLIARETTEATTLAGERLDEGTPVMIVNAFNHRDPDRVADADRVVPERWHGGERDYRFNHLSNGTQWCPGEPLVLLLGKAVLARTLAEYALEPEAPGLDPGGPLPHMLDFYRLTLRARRREEARA